MTEKEQQLEKELTKVFFSIWSDEIKKEVENKVIEQQHLYIGDETNPDIFFKLIKRII